MSDLLLSDYPDENLSGWNPEKEQEYIEELMRNSVTMDEFTSCTYNSSKIPEEHFPDYLKIEDQKQQGACQGKANTSCTEVDEYLESGCKKVVHYSAQFAYEGTQKIDGIRGDRGSTITGGAKFAKEIGHCLDKYWPYTGRHSGGRIPRECYENAEKKVKTTVHLKTADEVIKFITGGHGAVLSGSLWPKLMDSQKVINQFLGPRRGDRHGGGHAVCFWGWRTVAGEIELILNNSWGIKFWGGGPGMEGRKYTTYNALREMERHEFTCWFGFTGQRPEIDEDGNDNDDSDSGQRIVLKSFTEDSPYW